MYGPGFGKFGLKNFLDFILDKIIFSNYLVGDFGELGFGELGGRLEGES